MFKVYELRWWDNRQDLPRKNMKCTDRKEVKTLIKAILLQGDCPRESIEVYRNVTKEFIT